MHGCKTVLIPKRAIDRFPKRELKTDDFGTARREPAPVGNFIPDLIAPQGCGRGKNFVCLFDGISKRVRCQSCRAEAWLRMPHLLHRLQRTQLFETIAAYECSKGQSGLGGPGIAEHTISVK